MSRRVPILYAFNDADTALNLLKANAYVEAFASEMKGSVSLSDMDKYSGLLTNGLAWEKLKGSDDPVEIALLAMMIWHNSVEGE